MPSILDPEPTNPDVRAGRKTAILEERVAAVERKASTSYHQVGTSIAPYSNGWRSYFGGANDFTPVYFYRDVSGRVYIDGLADKTGGDFVAFETIFTLPLGYRPDRNLIFVVESAGGSPSVAAGTSQIRVDMSGIVKIGDRGGPLNPVAWLSFAGVQFRVA